MAINVIEGGVDSFNYLAFPQQHPANQEYIYNQLGEFSSSISEIGRNFLEGSRAVYENIHNSATVRAARAAVRGARGVFHPNVIIEITDLDGLRGAQLMMQRYIMAQPDIRDLYHRQRCDGYSDTYMDIEPQFVRDDHYDYRRVMDGMMVEDEDGWHANIYAHDDLGDDRDLTMDNKVDIINTWELVALAIRASEDPTDPSGAQL